MRKLSDQHKIVICYLGLLIMLILMGNSNNVPEPFAERIFKPIMGDGWAVHYAGILIIFGIYYCLKQLNKIRQNSLVKTGLRRFVVTLVLLNTFSSNWGYCIQIYKGFFNDLNSIYLDRGKTSVQLQGHERVLNIDGVIALKNCSNEPQS
ncbi:MAG: hypothetical protein ACRCS6_06810, partial [Turicibacter sp.]